MGLLSLIPKQTASVIHQVINRLFDRKFDQIEESALHFHDGLETPIAWNDVQSLRNRLEYISRIDPDTVQGKPTVATEGYNQHYHKSEYDGGLLPMAGPHDHRDNNNGGFAFAVFHPGTSVPQQIWEEI